MGLLQWQEGTFDVAFTRLNPIDADEKTREAVDDWRYWVEQGYSFCE
jgi:trehalose utilization protein